MNPQQRQAVANLPPEQRLEHFLKVVADGERLWGLRSGRWMSRSVNGVTVVPVWPEREYGEDFVAKAQAPSTPLRAMDLYSFLDSTLPEWESRGLQVEVFPTPQSPGTVMSVPALQKALEKDLERYQ